MSDQDPKMSPLLTSLLMILHRGSIGAAALLVLFIGIFIWQHVTADHQLILAGSDRGFLGLMIVLLAFALYLVWSIGKELKKSGA